MNEWNMDRSSRLPEVLQRNFQIKVMALLHLARWAAQRILTEAIAREMGPRGVHASFMMIDAVIDVPWARARFQDKPDDFFIRPSDIAEEVWHVTRVRPGRS